jgi:hypothetical protein
VNTSDTNDDNTDYDRTDNTYDTDGSGKIDNLVYSKIIDMVKDVLERRITRS